MQPLWHGSGCDRDCDNDCGYQWHFLPGNRMCQTLGGGGWKWDCLALQITAAEAEIKAPPLSKASILFCLWLLLWTEVQTTSAHCTVDSCWDKTWAQDNDSQGLQWWENSLGWWQPQLMELHSYNRPASIYKLYLSNDCSSSSFSYYISHVIMSHISFVQKDCSVSHVFYYYYYY